MARKKKNGRPAPDAPGLFSALPPPPPAAPATSPPAIRIPERESAQPSPSGDPPRAPVQRTRPLQGVMWLLGEAKKRPEWQPGELAVHVVPISRLAGHTVAVWQIRRLEFDIHNHRLLALCRACPPSAYPLLERWIPLGELILLRVGAPLEWEPFEAEADPGVPPLAAQAGEPLRAPAALLEWRTKLLLGPCEIANAPLRRLWSDLEQLATGKAAADDPVAALMDLIGLSAPAPVEPGAFRAWLVGRLFHLGARADAVRRMLTEAGLSGDVIRPLLAASEAG